MPEAWEGRRFVFMAGLQVGITVKQRVERIIEGDPTVVLLGGDFIYHPTEDEDLSEALEEYETKGSFLLFPGPFACQFNCHEKLEAK